MVELLNCVFKILNEQSLMLDKSNVKQVFRKDYF